MRPFITISILFGGALLGYFFRNSMTLAPNVGSPITASKPPATSQNFQNQPTQHRTSKLARKVKKHESKRRHISNPDAQRSRSGEDEGTSISADEIESIASIYQDQERRVEQPESTAVSDSFEQPKSQSVSPIPGVKIAAWVSSNKNRINTEVPDPKVGSGMRVFLNCVELKKKGASPLEQSECEKVVASKESVGKVSLSAMKKETF